MIGRLYYLFIIIYALTILTTSVSAGKLLGLRFFAVSSASMDPSLSQGSLIAVKAFSSYQVGDIIVFHTTIFPGRVAIVAHRVVDQDNGVYTTQGDANQYPDLKFVNHQHIIGLIVWQFPVLGYVYQSLSGPLATLLFVILPALIIITIEIIKIICLYFPHSPLVRKLLHCSKSLKRLV